MTEKEIVKIIKQVTYEGWWQPYGEYDEKKGSIYIIEEQPPFFRRINPRWMKKVAKRIIESIKEVKDERISNK